MSLELIPAGRLRVWADPTKLVEGPGPINFRTLSVFKRVLWETDEFCLDTTTGFGMYSMGNDVAQIEVRTGFQDQDGARIFLDYVARASMADLKTGKAPAYSSGRVDVLDEFSKYSWLSRTQIVGKGFLDLRELVLDYEIHVLR